jgi:hypothetical protein
LFVCFLALLYGESTENCIIQDTLRSPQNSPSSSLYVALHDIAFPW